MKFGGKRFVGVERGGLLNEGRGEIGATYVPREACPPAGGARPGQRAPEIEIEKQENSHEMPIPSSQNRCRTKPNRTGVSWSESNLVLNERCFSRLCVSCRSDLCDGGWIEVRPVRFGIRRRMIVKIVANVNYKMQQAWAQLAGEVPALVGTQLKLDANEASRSLPKIELRAAAQLVQFQFCDYGSRVMTLTLAPARRCWLILLLLVSILIDARAQTKSIRLRNEIITTSAPDPNRNLRPQAAEAVVSGLYLIQFDGPLQLAWRARLASQGVDLLRFVPDDAFVVRVESARLSQVRGLPFVRWVGEYRPEHKTQRALHPELAGASTNALVPVSLLLSPHVTAAEVLQVTQIFQRLRQHAPSKFGSILSGQVTPAQLGRLAKSDSVLWIEPAPKMKLIDEISSKIVGGGEYAPSTGAGGGLGGDGGDLGLESLRPQATPPQTNSHATVVQQLGFDGTGVVVCVADSGLNNGDAATMHPDLFGRVDAFFFYGALPDAADEHSHGTHVAGINAGNGATGETDDRDTLYGLGVASNAHLVAQRIFDAAGKDYLPPYETLTHDAVRAGAVVGSNSWGDDVNGRYDLSAAQFDALVRDADADTPDDQPYILEFSAGNAGPGSQTLDSPAVAKNVIATGASQNDRPDFFIYADGIDAMADFSSRGPCEDGRIKPDIGCWRYAVRGVPRRAPTRQKRDRW